MESNHQNSEEKTERDISRYEKMNGTTKTTNILCVSEKQNIKATLSENGKIENITCLYINFVDAEGVIHELTQDKGTLFKIQIFFSSYCRILAVYETLDHTGPIFCSWGYKKSSASTEKLFVYFKTKYSAYMACADAKHPEHQFLLWADDIGDHNPIENQYQFLKSLISKG